MNFYSKLLTRGIGVIASLLAGPGDLVLATQNPVQRFVAWIVADPKRQRIAGRLVWVLILLVLLLLTIVFIPGLGAQVWTSKSWSIGVACAVWGLVIGFTVGLVLPSKVVTAVSGAAAGLTLNDLTSGSYRSALDALVKQVADLVVKPPDSPDLFVIRLYVVVFLIFVALACAPAFFTD